MHARPPRPTDIMALVSFEGRIFPNEAKTRDHLGLDDTPPHPLGPAFEQWFSFATGRRAWISIKGNTIRGLVTARERSNRYAWEIDCLIVVDDSDEEPVGLSLLEQVVAAAGRARAHKVFLRLETESPLVETARRAGFIPYLEETLYRCDQPAPAVPAVPLSENGAVHLRKRTKADAYPLFRLYNGVVPYEVRRMEAMTLEEWLAAQEQAWLPKRTGEFILESAGEVIGWLRLTEDSDAGRFDLLLYPQQQALLDPLIETALARLSKQRPLFSLVPRFAAAIAERLEGHGFRPVRHYVVCVRRTVVPLTVRRLLPARLPLTQSFHLLRSQRQTPHLLDRYTIVGDAPNRP